MGQLDTHSLAILRGHWASQEQNESNPRYVPYIQPPKPELGAFAPFWLPLLVTSSSPHLNQSLKPPLNYLGVERL